MSAPNVAADLQLIYFQYFIELASAVVHNFRWIELDESSRTWTGTRGTRRGHVDTWTRTANSRGVSTKVSMSTGGVSHILALVPRQLPADSGEVASPVLVGLGCGPRSNSVPSRISTSLPRHPSRGDPK